MPGNGRILRLLGWSSAILVVAVVVAGTVLWEAGYLPQETWRHGWLIHFFQARGVKGALICIGAEFAQVVVFAIPGSVIEFAAGYVFGPWRSLAYLLLGVIGGTTFNFYFARIVGRPILQRLIDPTTLDRVNRLLAKAPGKMALLLLFLLPETPKDALCYGAGLTRLRSVEFILISSLSRSPVILATTMLASQVNHHQYRTLFLTSSVVLLALAGFYGYRRLRRARAKTRERQSAKRLAA